MHELNARSVTLKATEQPIDTRSAAGKAFLDMLGVFAEFETNLRRERQMDGIALVKTRGVYRRRKPSIDRDEIRRLRAAGVGPSAIARRLAIALMRLTSRQITSTRGGPAAYARHSRARLAASRV